MIRYIKQVKLSMALTILFMSCSISGYPFDLYVSTKGNDNNPGTKSKPFATIKRAQQEVRKIKGSVTVYVRRGVYYLTGPVVFSGDDARGQKEKIVYKAYPGEQIRISGGISLKLKWEPYKGDIKMAKLSTGLAIDQLFVNGILQQMARYPNYDSNARYYNGFAADALSNERIKTWNNPQGGYIHSLHKHEWGGFHSIIIGKDDQGGLITEGGWQNNRQMGMHDKIKFVENIFEELDAPGEWFYNKGEKILYFYPPKGYSLENALIEVPQLKSLFEFRGTQKHPLANISVEGFEITQTLRTFMETREPLLRSDWAIYRGGAVVFEGTQNCSLKNCFINSVGGNAVFFNNYNRNSEVSGCRIANTGASGICFVGDPSAVRSPSFEYNQFVPYDELDKTPGPKSDNYPSNCKAYNNLIYKIGRIEKQAAGVEISMAMDITVSNNTIYDVPRAGINIGDGCWGGHVLEFNDVFNTVLETGDHGAFNSWGRDRYWHPVYDTIQQIANRNPGLIMADVIKPITIRNNRFRCDHGWDIDLDDGSSNYNIYNNLCLQGGIKLREGFNRTVTNNIMINNSFHPHVWFTNSHDIFKNNIISDEYKPIRLAGWGDTVDYNFFPDTAGLQKARANGTDLHSMAGDPQFIHPSRGEFNVKATSGALKAGFKNFPMNKFGVVSPRLKKLAKQPSFPAQLYAQMINSSDAVTEWNGARLKKLNGLGERSATGMAEEKGVYVLDVKGGSVASKLGLQKNDVILKVDSQPVNNIKDMITIYGGSLWKGIVPFLVFRNQGEMIIMTKNE
jgi:hypothetical protein